MQGVFTMFVGNLGRDAEVRYTPSGTPVANFSVAVNERWNDSDGNQQERTTWVQCALWGKRAEGGVVPYLVKGKQVLIEGTLRGDENGNPRVFDRKDGTSGASFEVNVRDVRLLGSNGTQPAAGEEPAPEEDEIPF